VTLLVDATGDAVDAFGMLDPAPKPAFGQARAGTFFIDRDGVVRQRWLTTNYTRRPDPEAILARIR